MIITKTGFKDLLILEPVVHQDERGFFVESYNKATLHKNGIDIDFVQDNQSFSKRGVLRGLHFQKEPHAQTKLVRALSGTILDVVVDLRADQPTYKKHFSIELSEENRKQLLVPKGFAHAFVVLSDTASVLYKCDEYYTKNAEGGVRFDDPQLKIDWGMPKEKLVVSSKDLELPLMDNMDYSFKSNF
jgi:dTDP-4-dehydrorhamnose 3,5-epimerase